MDIAYWLLKKMSKYHKILLFIISILFSLGLVSHAQAATQIYRSVSPAMTSSLADDNSHANTVSVSSSVATFSTALPDNVGVGDAVLIDTNLDNSITSADTILFISGRTDSTHYTLQTNTGTVPSDISSNDTYQIFRAYTSLANAESGTKNTSIPMSFNGGNRDVVTNNEQWNIACYANGTTADSAVQILGWTTDATHFIKIYTPYLTSQVGTSQRHSGVWDTSKYYVSRGTGGITIDSYQNYTVIEGLQVTNSGTASTDIVMELQSYHVHITASSNIIRGGYHGIESSAQAGDGDHLIYNTIVYGAYRMGINSNSSSGHPNYVYNNSVSGCVVGNVDYSYGIGGSNGWDVIKNNISINQGHYSTYQGDVGWGSQSYNICQDTSCSSTGSLTGKTNTNVKFVNITPGSENLHLQSGSVAINAGTDLSGTFTTDIDGNTRPQGSAWDIGADERLPNPVYYSVGQNTADHSIGANGATCSTTGTNCTVTVSGTTATFATPQTATNMGVGDVVTYTGGTCYISGKTSTTVWSCVSVLGGTPTSATNASVTSIAHAFASLSAAITGASGLLGTADLTSSGGYILNIPCYYDSGADTTTVSVTGYTTSATNYIKIYTPTSTTSEVNQTQRHSGKWDTTKYSMEVNNDSGITGNADFVRVDGLQIKVTSTIIYKYGLTILPPTADVTDIRYSNNIIKGVLSGGATNNYGIKAYQSSSGNNIFKIWNNIIYGSTNGNSGIFTNYVLAYVYNNTVYGCSIGIYSYSSGSAIVKNNIAYNNSSDYSGTFTSASTNNLSKDATAPGAGACPGANCYYRSKTLTFTNTTSGSENFHLAATDTSAIGQGVNLANDASLPFSTDIDSNVRGLVWDIGADQFTPAQAYFSVGQSTADLKVASTLDITSGAGVFSAAQTGNIGVGDVVTYNTNVTAYISAKTNADGLHWSLVTATGAVPADISGSAVVSIKHVYTSLNSAVAGAGTLLGTTNLTTANVILNIPCYYDSGPDTALTTVSGYTVSSTNYIKIYTPNNTSTEANNSQRHRGIAGTGYSLSYASGYQGITINLSYTVVDGLEITTAQGNSNIYLIALRNAGGGRVLIENCLLHSPGGYEQYGVEASGSYLYTFTAINNIIYGMAYGIYSNTSASASIYNNTVYGCNYAGIVAGSGASVKNNIVTNSTTNFTGGSTQSYNISSDGTASGTGSKTNQTVSFVNATGKDFHLQPTDTSAKDAGTDLSVTFNTDIDGQPRPAGPAWDIGADEAPAQIFYSVGQNTSNHCGPSGNGTSCGNVSITSGLATFDAAQSATNLGVGDALVAGGNTYYLVSKTTDNQHWNVVTNLGALPANLTSTAVTSIAHAFASLSAAVTGSSGASFLNTTNLVTGNYQLNIPCYYDTGSNTSVTVNGYTTNSTHYIKIYAPYNTATEVNLTQRHSGKWDATKYNISFTNTTGPALVVLSDYTVIDGIQVKYSTTQSYGQTYAVLIGDGGTTQTNGVKIQNDIVWVNDAYVNNSRAIVILYSTGTHYIYNNVIYSTSGMGEGIERTYNGGTLYIYNNTIKGANAGIFRNVGTFIAKNNIVQNCTTNYSGSFDGSSTNNLSADSTAPGTNAQKNKTVNFVDAANFDFHLQGGSVAINAGVDLSADPYLPFTTDIDGQARTSGKWDIGADENNNVNVQINRNVNFGRNVQIK